MKTKLILFVCVILLTNCHKNKPKPGSYQVSMIYAQSWKDNKSYEIVFTESNKNWIIVGNQDTLYKNKSKVEGYLTPSLHMVGKIERNGFSTRFKITGTFTKEEYTQSMGTFYYNGTFEIK